MIRLRANKLGKNTYISSPNVLGQFFLNIFQFVLYHLYIFLLTEPVFTQSSNSRMYNLYVGDRTWYYIVYAMHTRAYSARYHITWFLSLIPWQIYIYILYVSLQLIALKMFINSMFRSTLSIYRAAVKMFFPFFFCLFLH